MMTHLLIFFFFFFNDTATTEIYTLSLHDALPIYTHSGFVEVRFRDERHGIKPPVMSRVFDPFFTTRKPEENFGLGLFKARGDLARMKGGISAESDGTTYAEILVRLPDGG